MNEKTHAENTALLTTTSTNPKSIWADRLASCKTATAISLTASSAIMGALGSGFFSYNYILDIDAGLGDPIIIAFSCLFGAAVGALLGGVIGLSVALCLLAVCIKIAESISPCFSNGPAV